MDIAGGKHQITYGKIIKATEGFSDKYLIGSGSFGKVYKVLLGEKELEEEKNKLALAVKVLNLKGDSNTAHQSFRREIEALKFVRHRNVLGLLGSLSFRSIDMDILIYEYMPKDSLWDALMSKKLDWKTRYNIALGVAAGLKYLHHDCSPAIVHCDLKSANILLDDEYVPRVADFGLAKLIQEMTFRGQSSGSSVFAGSFGYMAPECAYGVRPSVKQDVFSFGVVLLELVTGKRAILHEEERENISLAEWAAIVREEGGNIVDSDLQNDYDIWSNEIEKVTEIALVCTRSSPQQRPSMRKIVDMLSPAYVPVLVEY
ncbi:hypothetical protein KI387_021677 [Taxus chinensis]|uniref:Protein kinase domain-containing protein n=1 Tax=Taxus chinensis TaxID=29808 RepID=A0AA38LCH3_TAXCH|nr:hypothetical protein KI387_021677 [Taxus chinensis]